MSLFMLLISATAFVAAFDVVTNQTLPLWQRIVVVWAFLILQVALKIYSMRRTEKLKAKFMEQIMANVMGKGQVDREM